MKGLCTFSNPRAIIGYTFLFITQTTFAALPHIFCIFNIKCHSMQIYSHIECKGMITIMILKLLSFQKGSSISQGHIVLPLNICFLSLQYKYIHLSALKLLMTFFAKLSYICLFIKSFNNFLCYITVAE